MKGTELVLKAVGMLNQSERPIIISGHGVIMADDPEVVPKPRRRWFEKIQAYRSEIEEATQREIDAGLGKEGQLLMKTIVAKLSKVTGGKDIIVSDVGQHQMMLARFYRFQTFNSWFTSGGASTMGCALPMAVGVKLARPDEQVWAVSGDGGIKDMIIDR